jgi:hypothetical protein
VAAKLTPHPIKTLTEPLRLKNPDPFAGARTFIALTQDLGGSAGVERAHAESGWRHRELDTGHDAMVTAPQELADLLLEIFRT